MRKVIDKYADKEIREILAQSPQAAPRLGLTSAGMTVVKFSEVKFKKPESKDTVHLFDSLYDVYIRNRNRATDGFVDINGVKYEDLDKPCENVIKVLIGAHITKNNEWLTNLIYEYTTDFARQSAEKCITFPIIPKAYSRDKSSKTRVMLVRLNVIVSKMLDDAGIYYNIGSMDKLKAKKSTPKSKQKKSKSAMEKLNESNK